MSDGPHRSLNMRPGWKKVAEFADRDAFSINDIGQVVESALSRDWNSEIPDTLVIAVAGVLEDQQYSLFVDQKTALLSALRPDISGRPMAQVLLDSAMHCVSDGGSSEDSMVKVVSGTLKIWATRHARQVEEHYLRSVPGGRARNVRSRIEQAFSGVTGGSLAGRLLRDETRASSHRLSRRSGLDEGVRLVGP